MMIISSAMAAYTLLYAAKVVIWGWFASFFPAMSGMPARLLMWTIY
jgi:hypothetical protein